MVIPKKSSTLQDFSIPYVLQTGMMKHSFVAYTEGLIMRIFLKVSLYIIAEWFGSALFRPL